MAVVVYERYDSRSFDVDSESASMPLELCAVGSIDENEIYQALAAAAPLAFFNLVRKKISASHQGGGVWLATVDYSTIDPADAVGTDPEEQASAPSQDNPLGPNYQFDTSGQTAHITQSRSTRSMTLAGGNPGAAAPDNKLAIGISGTDLKGTDIYTPKFEWSFETRRARCTLRYLQTLSELTGRVNYDRDFFGWPKGSVLYLGASGRYTVSEQWTITHKFACQPRELSLRISPNIVIPEKLGWDYVWVGYEPAVNNNILAATPKAAYVEIVYPTGDFRKLEIGE